MAAAAHLVVPAISVNLYSIFFSIILLWLIIFLPYEKIVVVLKYFCLTLLLYIFIPFFVKQDWLTVLRYTFIPAFQFNKDYIGIIVAILGTSISPYMFFWQTTMAAEDKKNEMISRTSYKRVKLMRADIGVGMVFSNVVMYFIILTTGSILFPHGITQIATVKEAAQALQPLAGNLAYLLFAIGIIGTGFLAIPVLSGVLSYMLCTAFDIKSGLDKNFYQAKGFYSIIGLSLLLALFMNFIGLNPIRALLWTAMSYGVITPVMILLILHMANKKEIMNTYTNSISMNILGGMVFLLMLSSVLVLLYVSL